MKNKFHLFLLIILFLFTSCEDNKVDKAKETLQKNILSNVQEDSIKKKKKIPKIYQLNFISLDKEPTALEIKENIYNFSNILQPIVLVNFFATWCPPCRGQIPHLNNLQNKYKEKLFMMGVLLHDDLKSKKIKNCISLKKVDYYISQSKKSNKKFAEILADKLGLKADFELPMMVMFVYGEYYTHYEGTVPEEMIESDIKQALNEIEG